MSCLHLFIHTHVHSCSPFDVGLKYEPGHIFCEIRPQISPHTLWPSRIYPPQLKATWETITLTYTSIIPFSERHYQESYTFFCSSPVMRFYDPERLLQDEVGTAGALILSENGATAGRTLPGYKPMFLACNYAACPQPLLLIFDNRNGLWHLQFASASGLKATRSH